MAAGVVLPCGTRCKNRRGQMVSSCLVPDRSGLFRALQKSCNNFGLSSRLTDSSSKQARKNRVWSTSTLLFQVGKHLIISSFRLRERLLPLVVCFLPFPIISSVFLSSGKLLNRQSIWIERNKFQLCLHCGFHQTEISHFGGMINLF